MFVLFNLLSFLLLSSANADADEMMRKLSHRPTSRFQLQKSFVLTATQAEYPGVQIGSHPFPPTAGNQPFIWEEWGLHLKPFVRANAPDSTDSMRFFGRIHKAAVWDAKVR